LKPQDESEIDDGNAMRMNMQALAFEINGKTLHGHFWTHDWMVMTKLSSRQATTHIGGSPPRALARLILVEMEEARLGNPMFAGVVHASE
jgi:hypothetical protein